MDEKPTQEVIAKSLGLKRKGSEYCGPCPLCGGKDRFHVRKDGVFGCRQCGDASRAKLFKEVMRICKGEVEEQGDRYTPRPQSEDDNLPKKKPYRPSTTQGYKDLPEGNNVTVYEYSTEFAVVRHDMSNGKKSVRPWTRDDDGLWYCKGPGDNRPLYGMWELHDWPDREVVVVEGEKCRDALWHALKHGNKGRLPVAYSGGAGSWDKTDWSPLTGRNVLLLSDADAPGRRAFVELGRYLQGLECDVSLALPEGKDGKDVADWLTDIGTKATFRKIRELSNPLKEEEGAVQGGVAHDITMHEAVQQSVISIISKGDQADVCCVDETDVFISDPTTGLWIRMGHGANDWERYAAALYATAVADQYHCSVTSGRKFTTDLRDTLVQNRNRLSQVDSAVWNKTNLHPLLPLRDGGCWHMRDGKVLAADEVKSLYIERNPVMRLGPTPRAWDPETYPDQLRGSIWLDQWGSDLVQRFARNLVVGPAKHMDVMVQPASNWGKGAFMDTCQDAFAGLVTQSDPNTLLMAAGGRFDTLREKLSWAHVVFVTEVRDHEVTADRIVSVTESVMEFERKGENEEQRARKGTLMLLNTGDVNMDFKRQGIINRTPWILDLSDDDRTMDTDAYYESCAPGKAVWFRDYVCHLATATDELDPSEEMLEASNRYREQHILHKEAMEPDEVQALRALYEYTGDAEDFVVQSEMKTELALYLGLQESELPKTRAWAKLEHSAFPKFNPVLKQRRTKDGEPEVRMPGIAKRTIS